MRAIVSDLGARRRFPPDPLGRLRGVNPGAARIVELVAEACHESPAAMLQRSRQGDVAFARQLAMYLTHVMLGLNLTEAGRLFGRDRTTVAHACGLIEDRRDDPDFEALVAGLEAAVRSSGASAQHPLEAMRHAG